MNTNFQPAAKTGYRLPLKPRGLAAVWLMVATLLVVGVAGCEKKSASVIVAPAAPKTVDDRFAIKIGERTVAMQVAALKEEMQQGLMYRQSMGENEGMIFVFEKPQHMSFWMRNTEIPLDIGYLDANGVLKEIYPMYPRDEHSVGSRSHELQFALEMNQGWFARAGVKPGAQLDMAALTAALRARGVKTE